jgi:ice-binding like protein
VSQNWHQQKDFMNVRIAKKVVGTVGPMMQGLEGRVMLSGNVTASVVSGSLVLKGDAAANDIVMTRSGLTATQIRISSGSSATTINGAAGPLVLSGVRGLKVQLMGGNDSLKLDDAGFDRPVSIDAGSGNDMVYIEANGSKSGAASIFKAAVSVVMGTGVDGLQVGVKGEKGNHATFRSTAKFNGGLKRDVLTYSDVRNLASGSVAAFESINPVSVGINLRSARTFGILAGAGVSNTGGTIINGNLGTHPTGTVVGAPTVNGVIHSADPIALQAKADLTSAYNAAKGRAGTPTKVLAGELSGLTLAPGVYKRASSVKLSSGHVTLDAKGDPNAVFIFQIGTTLTTLSGTQVILAGGAKARNIYWQVGSSATLGTTSSFKGTILADQSITLTHLATLEGRALARIGAVTTDSNTVTVPA